MQGGLQGDTISTVSRSAATVAVVLLISLGLAGCRDDGESDLVVAGAGASSPALLYRSWATNFDRSHPGTVVAYDALGSSRGTELFFNDVVSFASTELPLTKADESRANGRELLQIPITVGAIVLAFNAGSVKELNLNQQVVADIYLGRITSWRHPSIVALNPDAQLPDLPIVPIHRVDGSGSTYALTRYLAANDKEWQERVGTGAVVNWPTTTGALGSGGMLQTIRFTPGSIGYLSFGSVMAKIETVGLANIENNEGAHIRPSVESIKAALHNVEGELLAELTAEGKESYPIVLVNYALVWRTYNDTAVADALKTYFKFGLSQSDASEEAFGYAQLPEPAVSEAMKAISSIRSADELAGGK